MRAGYALDEPGDGVPFSGLPGQVSTVHGTQHTNMRYSYVQRGGTEQFHPFDFLGFRYFQIDNPGEDVAPADIVALARHTAVPDEHAGTFTSSSPPWMPSSSSDAIPPCSAPKTVPRHTNPQKGPWLWDGFNESQTAMAAAGRPEPVTQVPPGVRRIAGSVLAEWCDQQDLPDRSGRGGHRRVQRDLCRVGVAVLVEHR